MIRSRRLFVLLSRLMAPAIRHGLIRSTRLGGSLCVLRTRGRRSGRTREAALDYATAPDGGIWVAAGWGTATAWYRNLLADPAVEVVCERRTWRGIAEPLSDPAERIVAIRSILLAAGFVGRAYGFDPATVPDARLAELFDAIPIIRIRRT